MVKIKRVRTADAVVAAFRFGKEEGTRRLADPRACTTTTASSTSSATRRGSRRKEKRELIDLLEPYRTGERGSGEPSRWKSDEELVWEGLRPELVCEIAFDHITGHRIRHGAKLLRWRDRQGPERMPYRAAARLIPVLLVLAGVLAPRRPGRQYQSRPTTRSWTSPAPAARSTSYGMRNPYRWSFDRATGDMLIGDVGGHPARRSTIPRARRAGANLGWNCPRADRRPGGATGCPSRRNYVAPLSDYPTRAARTS